jgi:exosome complex component MTR3
VLPTHILSHLFTSSFPSESFCANPSLADQLQDTEPAALSTLLTQLLLPSLHLHLLPKSSVDVYLLVLESDTLPSVLSAGLTVASAAIADAGIAMGALGVGAVISGEKDGLRVDPTKQEEQDGDAILTVGIMPALDRVTNLWLTGETDVDDAVKVSLQAGGEG